MTEADALAAGGDVLHHVSHVSTVAQMASLMAALPVVPSQYQRLCNALDYELRNQCYHYLNALDGSNYIDALDVEGEPDPCVKALAGALVPFLEAIRVSEPSHPLFFNGTLSKLISSLLMEFVTRIPRIDTAGMTRMHLNVFHLQQHLCPVLQSEDDEVHFERVFAYYSLVSHTDVRLLIKALSEGTVRHKFTFDEYVAILEKAGGGGGGGEEEDHSIRNPGLRSDLQKVL